MKEARTYYTGKVKQKGIFDFKKYYKFAYDWLRYDGYTIHEKKYLEEIEKQGKKIIIEWVATKKISDYFKNIIEVSWHILGMEDAEVMRNGKKDKANKGEVKITITGILERDYEDNWGKTAFNKFIRGVYDKYIIRSTMDQYEDKVIDESDEFTEQLKAFLNLEGRK